jgi:serine/threonine-protein kinase
LPGGKSVLYTAVDGAGDAVEIALLHLDTGERKTVIEGGGNSRYLPTGHLAYPLDGSLMVVPFDLDRGEIVGSPVSALDGLMMGFPWDPPIAHFTIADNGTLAFVAGPIIAAGSQLVRVDRAGATEPIGDTLKKIRGPRFSPDGRRVAVSTDYKDLTAQLWVHDLDRDTLTRLTFENQGWWPIWSPDGQRLAFTSMPPGEVVASLYWMPADGSAPPERLTHSELPLQATSFSPDGRTLILQQNDHPETAWDVMILRLDDESREPQPLLNSQFGEALAELSPNGRWLAYTSNESGRFEVYVRSFPDLDRKWQISTDGGIESAWSRDGTELFYRDEEGFRLMAVDTALEPSFRPGKPRLLFEGSFVESPGYGRNYDVAPDGQSFLMVKQEMEGIEDAQIHVVLDWLEELKRLVPVGGK